MHIMPLLLKDGYKIDHRRQYPEGTRYVYSNLTPRASRRGADKNGVIFFGLQYFVKEYLQTRFNRDFFEHPLDEVMAVYKRRIDNYLGPNAITFEHIAELHQLGYLPIRIKALPEGSFVPNNVPVLTIVNTDPRFFWLTNMLETIMSSVIWKMSTTATTAFLYRRNFQRAAIETGGDLSFVPWQGHDFSFRGMCGSEDAMACGAGHLLSFTGSDTIPAIDFLEYYYGANSDLELIAGSVAATEHSTMCMGQEDNEEATYRRLLTEIYPTGIVSVVSDTWDFWKVITETLPNLKDVIMARDGKLVIRPDSSPKTPVEIICGDPDAPAGSPENKGLIRCLWDTFEGVTNEKGYRVLDPHIGCIYGDSITIERQEQILSRLTEMGFASTNVVLGIGSYTYQMVTRDTDGWAMKATWGETEADGAIEIYKDPKTDSGTKKSHRGLLAVYQNAEKSYYVKQQVSRQEENRGALELVFADGALVRDQTLSEIRAIVAERI